MSDLDRRRFLTGSAIATLAATACHREDEPGYVELPQPPLEPGIVRVASVKTAVDGKLLPALIERFERASTYRVRLATGVAVYELAREGNADVVVSHYGHKDAEQFVLDGLGEWPRTIFSNQMALVGPPSDPARVR